MALFFIFFFVFEGEEEDVVEFFFRVDFFVDDERFLSAGDFFLLEVFFLFVGVEEDCLFLFVRFLLDPLILLVDMFFSICVFAILFVF